VSAPCAGACRVRALNLPGADDATGHRSRVPHARFSAGAACRTVGGARGHDTRDPVRDGRCGERCQAAGLARSDERLRQCASFELGLPSKEPPAMSTHRAGARCSRKCPSKSGNGGFRGFFGYPARRLDMTSSSPWKSGIQPFPDVRHFHPYGGPACAENLRPAQAEGAEAEREDLVSCSAFRSKIARCRSRTGLDHPSPECPIFRPDQP
jgi:hypothetical protein